ncbi:ADP-ribosylation factor-like protein 13B [Diaphorina citri]|uniref:ADP-ribosylation factor-like protein 13B n=1 Tax=Diaphorina citri TaxID=121845 RepID=A0A3Q0J603_DIACI|nr:ADP-ribosylation factor-like protein 13B [Diaphorina citri]
MAEVLLPTHLSLFDFRSVPILVLGLDNAGKSSIIKRILGEPIISLVPTVGFNRARVEYGNKYEVFLYDLGGSEDFRTIWKQYLGTAYGVIYVIDSNDFQRTEENRQKISIDEISDCP